MTTTPEWATIETAPKDGTEIDIWVTGSGSRRIADCRWGRPIRANWGDRFGDDSILSEQFITRGGFALDRRNGIPTHWRDQKALATSNRCHRCNGTGAIDAPYSGSDPSCPECDGTGQQP